VITDLAHKHNLSNIIPLYGKLLGTDHVGLVYPKYRMNLREYLDDHSDPDQLPLIIDQMINGVM
jgi:hypothetical protein